MQICNYNSINFMAKKLPCEKVLKNTKNLDTDIFVSNKENLYKDIEKFLKKDISKEEYFKVLLKKVRENPNIIKNKIEAKYVNDMLTTLDIVDNIEKIPEEYLIKNMENLLNYKKY